MAGPSGGTMGRFLGRVGGRWRENFLETTRRLDDLSPSVASEASGKPLRGMRGVEASRRRGVDCVACFGKYFL